MSTIRKGSEQKTLVTGNGCRSFSEIAVLSSTIVLALLNRFSFPAIQYTIIGIIILAACAYKPVRSFYLVEAVFSVHA